MKNFNKIIQADNRIIPIDYRIIPVKHKIIQADNKIIPVYNKIIIPVFPKNNIESKEKHKFTIEEIRSLLMLIDGKERPNLAIEEQIENIKGEPMSIVFTNGEKETNEGGEQEITYLLTLKGQRYNQDGTPGRMGNKTFLTKDYDGGYYSEELADYVDGEWVNINSI